MLKSLYIRNFVLIDRLDIAFDNGLSVITGETGAGKSIVIGALSLVLGQRADGKSIQSQADKCVIEAVFDVSAYRLETFFSANDLDYDTLCILRRELTSTGKSRSFINDSPVSLTVMKELGNQLIDIHSQHQNLMLANNRFQLKAVDTLAGNRELLLAYKKEYASYIALKKELRELKEQAAHAKQEEDYIQFQLEQLAEARLHTGEQEQLEQEQEILAHAEEIKGNLYRITMLLNGDEPSSLLFLKESLSLAESVTKYYPRAYEMAERLRTAFIDLNDLAVETDALQDKIEVNPQRQEWIRDRLNTIYTLQQKHQVSTVEELLSLQDMYEKQLTQISSFDESVEALTKQSEAVYKALSKKADELSRKRKKAGKTFAKQLIEKVAPLGMPHTRFEVEFIAKSEPGPDGSDDLRFLFSANKNGELMPVAQTASGGETSRLMLCIKALIAGSTALPTIIFDEVDAGVSGDIADKMGDIMRALGQQMQVLTITHLPQIAAKGKTHYFVYKEETTDRSKTCIRMLTPEERITETARMLSGATLTEASLANAKDLLGIGN